MIDRIWHYWTTPEYLLTPADRVIGGCFVFTLFYGLLIVAGLYIYRRDKSRFKR